MLCLNVFAKLHKCERSILLTSFNGQLPYLFICVRPISLLSGLLSVRSRWCARHEIPCVATTEVPLEKKVDTKYKHVNVLRNIASMTKRGDEIPTH